jgi:hypothetical protein
MAEFPLAIAAQLAGNTVRAAPLVHFDFRTTPMRLWPGFGPLEAAGETWLGLGDLGSISGTGAGPGQVVEEMAFSLAGGPELLANFAEDAEEATGREVEVWLQFFDEGWAPLDDPFQIFWGVMGPLKVERGESGDDPLTARATRLLSVTAANAFINRGRPSYGFFTDRDQKARKPGDNIFLNIARMSEIKVRWPKFSA